MTMDETRQANPASEDAYLVAAALADGERVDPAALKTALDDPAARDYLVDLMTLRQAVGAVAAEGDSHWRQPRSIWSRRGWWTAAAAILLSLTAGYFAGQRTVAQVASTSTVETVVDVGTTRPAPQPTRVVPLRPGVNWTEKPGEQ
jgi:hypothetical protein